jgi:acyl-coenzyme A thioesterase PaaI-like protein
MVTTVQSLVDRALQSRPSIAQLWSLLKPLPGGSRVFFKIIGALAPYTGTIDCDVRELETGHAEVAMTDSRRVRNHLGSVHAIALMNLGEVSTGLAVLYSVDGIGRGIITSLKMDYLKKSRGTITATCDAVVPTSAGRHDVLVESFLRDDTGDVVAKATAVWRISIGKPTGR